MHRALAIDVVRSAALFVDLQEEHRQDARFLAQDFGRVLANCARLQAAARAVSIPLFHAQYVVDPARRRRFHPVLADGASAFSDAADPLIALCPETAPAEGETLLVKDEASMFGDGRLGPLLLAARSIEWVFVAGVWTEACVDATVKGALKAGLRVILVKDACGSGTQAMHEIAVLNLANRLYGGAVVDTDAACRLMAGERIAAWQIEGAVPFRFTYETASGIYRSL